MLHFPHVDYKSENCQSGPKTLLAARAIVNLVYGLSATSYDFGLLDTATSFNWFFAARTYLQFMRARAELGNHVEAESFKAEAEVLRLAIIGLGVLSSCQCLSECIYP
jgi:hypothetical protein